jgi:hypothetical protein
VEKQNFLTQVRGIYHKARNEGTGKAAMYLIKRGLMDVHSFYYMKENYPAAIADNLTALPNGFEFFILTESDLEAFRHHPRREEYVDHQTMLDHLHKGDICLGIKCKGEIVALSWYSLTESTAKFYPASMGEKEAYLYDMFVFEEYRGQNLAPILRYKNYQILNSLGRVTYYSITERANRASLRFKQKLGAQKLFLAAYCELFSRYKKTFILHRY